MARKRRAAGMKTMSKSANNCGCSHHYGAAMLFAVLILVFGLVALLKTLGIVTQATYDLIWPIIIMIIGAKMLLKNCCTCC
ncbi:MAG: hypothetical protein J4451_02065 [DPANN group archaeon]|nr:hypothetical protein [DPANN group archaeon]